MDNLRQLLVAIAALTLLFSVVSSANPNYFAGYSAFAEDEDGEEDENSSSSNDEEEDHDDSDDRHESSEQTVEATFGQSSKVKLEIDDELAEGGDAGSVEAELEVEAEDGDLSDGDHAVSIDCDTPELTKSFDSPLVVEGGAGEFQGELTLVNGTSYEDCQVAIGDTNVDIPVFRVLATSDEEEEEEDDDDDKAGRGHDDDEDEEEEEEEAEDDDDDDDKSGRGHGNEAKAESEDNGVELEVETDVNMTDGTYDVQFTCEEPVINMTIEDALEVEGGEAKFKAEIDLADGTYNDCKVMAGDKVIASFDSLTAGKPSKEQIEEKRKEKRKEIVSTFDARDEHKRRLNANPASTGDYDPGWNYTLTANGTGVARVDDDLAESTSNSTSNSTSLEVEDTTVDIAIDMAVWKSNRALILLNVLGGTVEAGGETYTVELGYALYSTHHDVMRLGAFVSDEDGNIYKLKLRGAAADDAEFPTTSGETLEMAFEGNTGPARNSFSHWHLELDGTIEAE